MPEDKVIPVRVAIRCRPLIAKEINEGCQKCVRFIDSEPQIVLGSNRSFTYDYVFSPDHQQQEVFELAVKHLIKNIFKGYNATVLAYGQTGSGKTYTMGGCYDTTSETDKGVIPRVMEELFKGMEEKPEYNYNVKVSYLEIYNEDINDLLCPVSKREPLAIREDYSGGIKLPGLREKVVTSYEDTLSCLHMGGQSRTTGATAMNNTSSRSHAIFTIHIDMKKKDDENDTCSSKFHLVDLAGSERAKKTQAEGERFKEGVNINRGLLCLGNVISALGDDKEKRSYIPYRDSKLTRLLQDSLGGNSYTLMVACISPADTNMEETLNTLRYADRARKIKNKPIVNRDPQAAEILRLKQMVIELETKLQSGGLTVKCSTSTFSATSLPSTTSSISTSTSYIDNDAMLDNVKELTEKNKQLEEENEKLSLELQRAVDNSTNLCEKVIKLDVKCERLKNRLEELKRDTGVDFNVLSSSLDVNSHPELKTQMDKLRMLAEKVNNEKIEPEDMETEQDEEEDQINSLPETPDSRAVSKEYAFRQAKMSNELQELNKLLEKKELLAKQMTQNDDQMKEMRGQYETAIKEMNIEIESLQKEKVEMAAALENAQVNTATNKVAEQRRQRLKELEQQMSLLKRKINDQTKMLKMKEQSEKQVGKLNVDIQSMKQQRVKLMKQMKEDADEFRRWKMKKEKEVMQLQQKGRKRECEIAKLQRENQKQQTILKRKGEEAAAANRRLKEALAKQKQVQKERNQKFEQYDTTSIGNRVRSWLSHELEVRVSIREAKYHLDRLLTDRKEMVSSLKDLKDRIDVDAPPAKKLAWIKEGKLDSSSFEVENVKKQMEDVQHQVDQRNAQITDLQQKIVDADQECKGKSIWESLHTMVEAKCALKWLLEQAVSARADSSKAQGELQDSELHQKDGHEELSRLEKELENMKTEYDERITKFQKEHEDKVLFLLRQMKSVDNNETIDDEIRQRLKFQQDEIERLSRLNDDLDRKNEECESLKQHLTKAMYTGKSFALMPSIDDDHEIESPFLTPKPKVKVQNTKKKAGKVDKKEESFDEDLFDEETESEDNDNDDDSDWVQTPKVNDNDDDSDWVQTPIFKKRNKATRPPSITRICTCKGSCLKKQCGCQKQGTTCTDFCKCGDKCRNKEQPGSTTKEEDSISTTLNSTYNLEEKENISLQNNSANDFVEPEIPKAKKRTSTNANTDKNKSKSRRTKDSDISSSVEEGMKKRRRLLNGSNSFFKPLE